MSMVDIERRFSGVIRLYGDAGLARLQQSHVLVIGIGGVGSWAVEALARNAVGQLTLVDLDNVAESNVNRQIHAHEGQFGLAKVTAMSQRVKQINPHIIVNEVEDFITPENLQETMDKLAAPVDVVLDCTDAVKAKVALAVYCHQHKLPLHVSGSAGGRVDPTRIQTDDLALVNGDKLLAKVRQQLRKYHGFPAVVNPKKPMKLGINCVYSNEVMIRPSAVCEVDDTGVTGLNCAGYGSSVSVTAPFGFTLAQLAISQLAVS